MKMLYKRTLLTATIFAGFALAPKITWSQAGVCVTAAPNYCLSTGRTIPAGTACSLVESLCPPASPSSLPATNRVNPVMQGAANAMSDAIADSIANWLRGGNKNNNNDNAAAEAAAEAEREQEAEMAQQLALAEQKRQQMFDRLSHELMGFSNEPQLQLMGIDKTPDLQLMGMGKPSDLQPMGLGDTATAQGVTPLGPQTCFFGECGPSGSGPIEPWGDPKVVDLRDLQQGVDLALVATKAPPADQSMIMDQALAAAEGNPTVQINMGTGTPVPVVSEQGLLAFQQANAAYRQAHDSAYQLQQAYNQMDAKRQGVYTVINAWEKQLEADFQKQQGQMSLTEEEAAMAKLYDAALQGDLAYGKTWAEYQAAREQYYADRYALQMYLWKTALGAQGNPPTPPASLQSIIPGPPESDLILVLPAIQPINVPTKDDLKFLQQIALDQSARGSDAVTQKVFNTLEQGVAVQWSMQPKLVCPPNILNQYRDNPQVQQQVNAESQKIFTTQQQADKAAMQDAENEWNQKIAQLQSQGVIQPGVPLAQQVQSNPQLAAQLSAAQKQVSVNLDYKVTRAEYQAQQQWQKWIEQQESKLPQPQISSVGAVRD